jgi:3-phosphoglycerate kinase
MRCIDEVPVTDLRGKRVFLRTILNLPVDSQGNPEDIFRLKRALPTIEYLSKCGARTIIAGYFGRSGQSMRPVAEALIKLAPHLPIHFFGTPFTHVPAEVEALKEGECLVIENTRLDPGEETNDPGFATFLKGFSDIFVGDAFPDAHRNYASNVGLAKLMPAYGGFLMRDEVNNLDAARKPATPSFAILAGAKFETKSPLIHQLLQIYDHVFIAGALANDVYKAKGMPVGRSLISKELPGYDVLSNPHFVSPVDVTAETSDKHARVKKPQEVVEDDKIVDIGPDSVASIAPLIASAKFILWNGPTGLYEEGYISYTHAIAELIEKAVAGGAQAVIGGGDTIAALEDLIPEGKLGFLSTGGGSMLEYLLKGSLPAIDVLK